MTGDHRMRILPEIADAGLLTPEEQVIFQQVAGSDIWLSLRDALCWMRESIYASDPTDAFTAGKLIGAISTISDLLQTGPSLVVQYRRFQRSQGDV